MPTVTTSEPRGLARAAAAEAEQKNFEQATRERQQLEHAQTTNAVQIKLERLARKDPNIRDLLDEYTAARESLKLHQEQQASLKAEFAEQLSALQRELDLASDAYAAAAKSTEEFRTALEAARQEIEALVAQRTKLGEDLEAARSDASRSRAQLARAKDSKP